MARKLGSVLAAACAALLLLVAAGCGGDDDDSGSTTTTAASQLEDVTTDETGTDEMDTSEAELDDDDMADEEMTTSDDDMDMSEIASAENCRELGALSTKLSEAFGATGASDTEEYASFLEEFAERAPEEIRDDFRVVAESYGKIAEALEGFDPSSTTPPSAEKLAELQRIVAEIDQAELTAASANITTWITENCVPG
jgi:hypothetical protein